MLGWNCKIVVQSRRFAVIDICDYIIISGIDTEESIEKNTFAFITFVLLFLLCAKLLQKEDNRKFLMSIIYVYNSFLL